jgi:uncharacterized repeat protein (TIGR01451 family)
MNYRRLSFLIGIVTLAVGGLGIVSPGVIPLGPDRAVVVLIGVLALLQALRVIQLRRHGKLHEAKTADPERSVTTPIPGEDIESVLAQFVDRHQVHGYKRRIREGLTAATVAVLTRFEGYTESEAKKQVCAGVWTDDVYAASFLGDEDAPSIPLWMRVRHKLVGESVTQQSIRHTVNAISAVVNRHVSPVRMATNATQARDIDNGTRSNSVSDRPVSNADTDRFDENTDEIVTRESQSTGHWRGVRIIAFIGIGVGVIVEQPAVLLGGVVGIGYAAYARSPALPPGKVTLDRTLNTDTPDVGEEVTVTVTVTNSSDRMLPDIRVIDGVPEALTVETGSPRCGTALRPKESTEFSYTIIARRGVHEFGPTHVVGRNLSGGTEEERMYASDTKLTCIPSLSVGTEPIPLRTRATRFVGREKTPTTGEGTEFSATREYRPGDPLRRIDWNRLARSRELTTIEFREERIARVVILIDARKSAYVSPDSREIHSVERSVEAAGQIFTRLSDDGNRVGIAVAGSDTCWLAPDTGPDHRTKTRELLAVDSELAPIPKETRTVPRRWQTKLRTRLDPGTQIVYLSPLSDGATTRIARQLDEQGFPVTTISPDPTSDQSPSQRLAGVARQLRISTLRRAGIPVINWPWRESLDAALARHNERKSQ